jgi:hypothetical protein
MWLLRRLPRPDDVEEVSAVFALEQPAQLCAEHLIKSHDATATCHGAQGPGTWTLTVTRGKKLPRAPRVTRSFMMCITALMHAIKGALDQMIVLVGWRSEQRALGIASHERLWRLIGVAARARPLATSRKSFFLELGRVRARGGHGLLSVGERRRLVDGLHRRRAPRRICLRSRLLTDA